VSITIRAALPADAGLIHALILELAAYEKLSHEVVASAADTAAVLFGPAPRAFCEIAEIDGTPAGFALWFYSYSTFLGRHGLYLEDVYVQPAFRGRGAGKALMRHLARRCVAEGLGRFEWRVLDWNTPAIAVYRALGAESAEEWLGMRLAGEALHRLAEAT
jgi:diamine N-acetyltransferase